MNLYTAHQKAKSVTNAPRPRTNKNVFISRLSCPKSTSSCRGVLGRLFQSPSDSWSSDRKTSVTQSSTDPRDGADVGVGRTKMTAHRVVGDELEFLRQVRQGLVSQRLEYQDGQLVLDSA